MSDKVRCTACRGAKKVPKLGGIMGECNTCDGSGKIKACDKIVAVKIQPVLVDNAIIAQVAECKPVSDLQLATNDIKIDGKKALYKRKTIAK